MAKTILKKGKSSAPKKVKKPKLLKASLIAIASEISTAATVGIVFTSGLGQATASVFRKGALINMQSISTSGNIVFADVESGDAIAINGVCTGTAAINISVPTNPSTPTSFSAGNFNIGYDVL